MPKAPKRNFAEEQAANPLGPSYLLMPLPSEDTTVLGRILTAPPEAGRSLDEVSRPNPCADKLTPEQAVAQSAEFHDARELKASGGTKAMLGSFGFSADAEHATHFVYRVSTDKRVGRTDTTDYAACCQQKGCGYGFVGALVHGEGEYATGEETSAAASGNVMMVGSAEGKVSLRTLHKRKVKGFVAAVIVVTDQSKLKPTDPLGLAAEAGVQLESNRDSIKQIAEHDKVSVTMNGASYTFATGAGALTENDFIRRYRLVAGSDELDEYETRRNKAGLLTSGIFFGVSVAMVPTGLVLFATRDRNNDGITLVSPIMAAVGGLAAIPTGIWFFSKLGNYDGDVTDHGLSYDEAVVYRDKYNRALIKRTHHRVNSGALELKVQPMFGTTMGIQGTF